MKLLKLKFAYFLSYNDEINIDFVQHFASQLFLINGPTGSGKSTIFDAITYALYGKCASERQNEEIKSRYATDRDLCYVELSFLKNNVVYTIKRIPSQTGPSNNKSKQYKSAAYLKPNELTNIREVDQTIIELIGYDYTQFCQIVLLPQGKIQKLLMSDSKEKEQIFRTLFHSEHLLTLQEKIKNETLHLKQKIQQNEAIIQNYLQQLKNEEDHIIFPIDYCNEKITHLKQTFTKLNNKYQALQTLKEKIVERRQKIHELQNMEAQLVLLETNKDHHQTQKVEEFEKYLDKINEIEKIKLLQNNLETLKPFIQQLEQAYYENESQLNNHATLLQQLEHTKPTMLLKEQQRTHLKQEIERQHERLVMETKIIEQQDALKNIFLHDLSTIENQIYHLNEKIAYQNTLLHTLNEKKATLLTITKEAQAMISLKEIERHENVLQTIDHLLVKLKQKYHEDHLISTTLKQAKLKYYTSLATQLASQLQENKPCPVCGSLHHPNISNEKYEMTQDDIDILLQQSQSSKIAIANIETEIESLKKQRLSFDAAQIIDLRKTHEIIKQTMLTFNKEIQDLEKQRTTENYQEQLHELKQKHTLFLKENEENLKKQVMIQTRIEELEKQLANFQNISINDLEKQYATLNNELNMFDEHLEKTSAALATFKNQQVILENHLKEKKQQQVVYTNEIKQLKNHVHFPDDLISKSEYQTLKTAMLEYQKNVYHMQSQITLHKKTIATLPNDDIHEITTKIETIETNIHEITKKIVLFENTVALITKQQAIIQSLQQSYEIFSELNDAASGNFNKNNNISFERYVLSYYLSKVIELANIRYQEMSDQRYLFVLEDHTKGNAKKGLSIAVFDYYNGTIRSAQSLSGGESFQASLCLALGLSDYLHQKSAYNQIEILFIDEGFGSLDQSNLEDAINTLLSLKATGKTIGIISHLEELKNRIPYQIQVKKEKHGSQIKIVA